MNPTSTDNRYRIFITFVLLLILTITIVSTVILSWVPPVSRDALTHHLAVPKLYIEHGGIVEIPYIPFSYYPMNLDILYILPLYFGNDILPKLIHYTFALLTAGLIYRYLQQKLDTLYAGVGALIFLTIPVILKLSITVYVDLGLVFFMTAALIWLFKWLEAGLQFRHLVISAIFCGLGLGTKYNGLVGLFILVLLVPYAYIHAAEGGKRKKMQVKAIGYTASYLIVALLVFSPWMVRNMIWKGNPIYPLYNNVFKTSIEKKVAPEEPELVFEIRERTGTWNHLAIRRIIYNESWTQIALIPLRIFFEGQDDQPKYFDGKLNPFLLLLPIFAVIYTRRKDKTVRFEMKLLLYFSILFILISFLRTSIRIRYIAPVIPALTILSVFGLSNLIRFFNNRKSRLARQTGAATMVMMVLLMLSMNAAYLVKQFELVKPLDYISGRVDRDAYISRHRSEYPIFEYTNRHLPEEAKIMGLFMGNRRYYCDRQLIFGEKQLTKEVIRAQSAEGLRLWFKKRGYTHVILRYDLFKQWSRSLTDTERKILVEFLKEDLALVFRNNGLGLYRLAHVAA